MTAPDRPAVTEEEIREAAEKHAVETVCETCEHYDEELEYARKDFTAGARFALAACASQEQRRVVEAKIEALEEAASALGHVTLIAAMFVWFRNELDRLRKEIA